MDGLTKYYQGGRPVIINVDGVADDATIDIRPPDGKLWLILDLWAYHDDTSSRTLAWSYTDGILDSSKGASASIAAQVKVAFNLMLSGALYIPSVVGPVLINYNTFLQCTASALTAGKHIFARGFALEVDE